MITKLLNILGLGDPKPARPRNMQAPLIAPPLKGGVPVQTVKDSYGRSYSLIANGARLYRDGPHRRACVTFSYRRTDSEGAPIPRVRTSKKDRLRARKLLTDAA